MDHLRLFATEIFVFRPEGVAPLNEALREALLVERTRSAGIRASNSGGGWHSVPDLARRGPPFHPLFEMIVHHGGRGVRAPAAERGVALPPHRWSVQSWAMVMEDGHYTVLHDHAASHWSVAWYVDAGDAPAEGESGRLSFVDPRRHVATIPGLDLSPGTFTVTPEDGMLVVFPGSLQHYVHPYRGSRPRICVSANLRLEPVGPPA